MYTKVAEQKTQMQTATLLLRPVAPNAQDTYILYEPQFSYFPSPPPIQNENINKIGVNCPGCVLPILAHFWHLL